MKKPQSVHSILEKTFKSLEIDLPLRAYSIWGAWKDIVGETIALQTQPSTIRNRILFIDVSHSTWIQQLQFLKSTLLEKMNAFIGEPYLQDIRFRLGKISPTSRPSVAATAFVEEDLEAETLKRIEEVLRNIEDRDLRKTLRDVLVRGAKLEHYRKKSG